MESIEYHERKRILFFGLPWTFTKYKITSDILNIRSGLFKTYEDDCYMYKIQDVRLETSLWERIWGLGTIVCFTGDRTHPHLALSHIKKASEIKNYLLEASEQARRKRRTMHTLDISAAEDELDDYDD